MMARTSRMLIVLAVGVLVAGTLAAVLLGLVRQNTPLTIVGIGVCATPLMLLLATRHPTVLAVVPGSVLGFAPFAAMPGTGFPLVVAFVPVLVVVAVLHPARERPWWGAGGVAMLVYLGVSLVSAVATYTEVQSLMEFAKWALATLTMLVALAMSRPLRLALSRGFAIAAAAGALFSLGMLVIDRSGAWVERFGFIGYGGAAAVNARTAVVDGQEVMRAAGLYVDPNSAGLFFLFAIGIAAVVLTGTWRVLTICALLAGIAGTLSRSAIASLLVAIAVLALIPHLSAGRRLLLLGGSGLALVVAFMVPAVSQRLFDAFGGNDIGALARVDALNRYPEHMAGNWLFGRGWYLREFYDPVYGYSVNHAANTPLIVIYRAGLFSGIAFIVLLVLVVIVVIRAMRAGASGAGLAGGVLVGTIVVAFQLDFPVVTMPPLAMAFALLLAEAQALSRARAAPDPSPTDPVAAPLPAGASS